MVTHRDLPAPSNDPSVMAAGVGLNMRQVNDNILASDKVLYKGQAVAAVSAANVHVAEEALSLIDVEYDVLPAVTDVEEAMKDGAPQLHKEYEGNVADPVQARARGYREGLRGGRPRHRAGVPH